MADIGMYNKFNGDDFESCLDYFDEDMAEWMHHFSMTRVESRELDLNDERDRMGADMFGQLRTEAYWDKGEDGQKHFETIAKAGEVRSLMTELRLALDAFDAVRLGWDDDEDGRGRRGITAQKETTLGCR